MPDANVAADPTYHLLGGARALGNDATIRLTAFNSAASVRLALTGRRMLPDGRVTSFTHTLVPSTNRVASTLDVQLGDGWLLSAQVLIVGGAPLVGQTYAIVSLGTGAAGAFNDLTTLIAGDLSAASRIAWPGSPIRGSLDGAGALRAIAGTTPAAGAEVSETVPTGARWELTSLFVQFVTSAVAGNRATRIILDDGARTYFQSGPPGVQVASATAWKQFFPGFGAPATDNIGTTLIAIPAGLRLGAGHRIRTLTNALDAGDQYSLLTYVVREWIEGA